MPVPVPLVAATVYAGRRWGQRGVGGQVPDAAGGGGVRVPGALQAQRELGPAVRPVGRSAAATVTVTNGHLTSTSRHCPAASPARKPPLARWPRRARSSGARPSGSALEAVARQQVQRHLAGPLLRREPMCTVVARKWSAPGTARTCLAACSADRSVASLSLGRNAPLRQATQTQHAVGRLAIRIDH